MNLRENYLVVVVVLTRQCEVTCTNAWVDSAIYEGAAKA
jgi:hypothetical protein